MSVPITTTTVNPNHYSNEEDSHQVEERRQHHQENGDDEDDDEDDAEDDEDDDFPPHGRPPSLHYAQLGGVFHSTVGRRVVTCLSESPPPPDYGLMASERDGRVVAGCAATLARRSPGRVPAGTSGSSVRGRGASKGVAAAALARPGTRSPSAMGRGR